ncbi:MAG TPA: EamA family transporter [Terriglobales bacterium]|nr:EamA family transporter [Terriglobales bacterium]
MTTGTHPDRYRLILSFGLVYFFWGSTYLAISIGVEQIPPALLCGVRFLIAGVLMISYCALGGRPIWFEPKRLAQMAAIGTLLLLGGNLTLSYAEIIVPSGLAALIIACTPMFFLVLDTLLLGDHHLSRRGLGGLLLGVIGLGVLLWPQLRATGSLQHRQLWASLSLLGGCFSWALGSVLAKVWKSSEIDPLAGTSWQIIFAGLANLLVAIALGDFHRVIWTPRGVGAIAYLVVCGSLIGYTSYIYLLAHAPTSKVSTYAYVNPVVAVFLGWLIAHEAVDRYILLGSAIVVASVILVTSAKVTAKTVAEEMPAVESM